MGEPDAVLASRAMQINTRIAWEDSVQLVFSIAAGWEAHMLLSWASSPSGLPDLVVLGEKGTLHLWSGAAYVDYYPVSPRLATCLVSHLRPDWLREKVIRPAWQRIRIRVAAPNGYEGEMREFLAAVAEAREPALVPEEGRRDLEIVLRSYEALEHRARVPIGPHRASPPSAGSAL